MKTLPAELVSRVFLLGSEILAYGTLLTHRLAISAVYSSWRTTAISTQQLWSFIHVHLRDPNSIESIASLLNMHLERAYSVSIDITFHALTKSESSVARMWDTISKHLHRCRGFKIVGEIKPDLVFPSKTSMDRLESLYIASFAQARTLLIVCLCQSFRNRRISHTSCSRT